MLGKDLVALCKRCLDPVPVRWCREILAFPPGEVQYSAVTGGEAVCLVVCEAQLTRTELERILIRRTSTHSCCHSKRARELESKRCWPAMAGGC